METSLLEFEITKRGYKQIAIVENTWQYENPANGKLVIVDHKFLRAVRFQGKKKTILYCPGAELDQDILMVYSRYCDGDMLRDALGRFEKC